MHKDLEPNALQSDVCWTKFYSRYSNYLTYMSDYVGIELGSRDLNDSTYGRRPELPTQDRNPLRPIKPWALEFVIFTASSRYDLCTRFLMC